MTPLLEELMTLDFSFNGAVRMPLAAGVVSMGLLFVTGCGPSSVSPEEEVPADVVDATVGDPAAVEGAELPEP